jgi:GPH family glycoside/pentoside/hexuronide:cation symporter
MEASGFTGLEVEIPSAVAMVKNLYIWGSVLAWGLVAVLMIIYHPDKQYNTIITELAERENAKA